MLTCGKRAGSSRVYLQWELGFGEILLCSRKLVNRYARGSTNTSEACEIAIADDAKESEVTTAVPPFGLVTAL